MKKTSLQKVQRMKSLVNSYKSHQNLISTRSYNALRGLLYVSAIMGLTFSVVEALNYLYQINYFQTLSK